MASTKYFSETQEADDPICGCQQGNLFYLDMPQEVQSNLNLSFAVNGERTPVLTAETPYRHLNTREGTAGALQCYIQGREHTLISDLSEAGSIGSPEDLKVVIGHQPPTPVEVARASRIELVRRLIRNDGRVSAPVTTGSRLDRLEQMIQLGLADNEHQDELIRILQRVERETGQHYLVPRNSEEFISIQVVNGTLPEGQYDIDAAAEAVLDKVLDTILGAVNLSFSILIDSYEATGGFSGSNIPPAIAELYAGARIVSGLVDEQMKMLARNPMGVQSGGRLRAALRRSPSARIDIKRAMTLALLRRRVISITRLSNGAHMLTFAAPQKLKTSFGRINLHSSYRTSLFSASSQVSSGSVRGIVSGAFRGAAAIGVVFVVTFNVVDYFQSPQTEDDLVRLISGTGTDLAKMAISAVVGAAITATLIAAGVLTGPIWLLVAVGAGISILAGMVLDGIDSYIGVTRGLERVMIQTSQLITGSGDPIRW